MISVRLLHKYLVLLSPSSPNALALIPKSTLNSQYSPPLALPYFLYFSILLVWLSVELFDLLNLSSLLFHFGFLKYS